MDPNEALLELEEISFLRTQVRGLACLLDLAPTWVEGVLGERSGPEPNHQLHVGWAIPSGASACSSDVSDEEGLDASEACVLGALAQLSSEEDSTGNFERSESTDINGGASVTR